MLDKNLSKLSKIIIYLVLIFFSVILVSPFIYMISMALASPESNIKQTFTVIPKEFYWSNFVNLFTGNADKPVGHWLMNSLFIIVLSIIGQIFSSTIVAYGFAKMRYKHKNKLFFLLLSTMMLPGQITLIPVFVIFKDLGLYNSLWPLIIPQFFGSAYNIFFTRQFMTSIPSSLYEAAEIDGLGYFGIYRKIVFPLLKPAVCAIAIFTFNAQWGDIMGPLIYTSDVNKMTMALGAQVLSASSNPTGQLNMSILMCMSVVLTIPQVLIYFFGQKYLFQINISVGNSGTK
ncbi:carbohydrate ABC transporter permease [Clostridium hydrogenum]|uniref:carbohydrate ABC transporter permease n=1 Tax=Clostridium hydrogenum TaxID=2855764 RepID=UPI001F1BE55E|nr:carbohydrate ABC transporter permease [Clostridium hydrogenum]